MARNRFVAPDTVRLDLSDGDYLIVRKELNAGEQLDMFTRVMKPLAPLEPGERGRDVGREMRADPARAPLVEVLAYLLEWSFVDDSGTLISLRGQSFDFIEAAVRKLDVASFREVITAVQAHDRKNAAAREDRKANPIGEPALLPT